MKRHLVSAAAIVFAMSSANAQETTSATAGYWNYSANPSQPPVVNRVDQQSNIGGHLDPDVSSTATYSDPLVNPSIGTATANSTISNTPVGLGSELPPAIAALLGLTVPSVSMDAQAISTYPTTVGFNGNLPFASATAHLTDSIKFCSASGGGCGAVVSTSSTGYTLQVKVNYDASLQSKQNGENIGAAIGTSLTLGAAFDGLSGQIGLINQGTGDFAMSNASHVFDITGFNPFDLNSFKDFSFLADVSASPFSDGSEHVTFDDPIILTLLDGNGNIIPNLFVESQNGFFYDVTDGAVGAITATPLPASLPLFATGLGALGLLGWRRKKKLAV